MPPPKIFPECLNTAGVSNLSRSHCGSEDNGKFSTGAAIHVPPHFKRSESSPSPTSPIQIFEKDLIVLEKLARLSSGRKILVS